VATQTGRQTKKQGDFTGRQAAAEAAKAAEAKKTRDAEMAMITAEQQREFDESVFDVTENPTQPVIVDEVVEVGVQMADDSVVVRVAEDIDNMTVGYKNTYTFKAGGKYKVPRAVADRLERLGLLWH
jgi:hypothetical protein